MNSQQDTLIYLDSSDRDNARIMAKCFANEDVRNRAYINGLGAQAACKYLTSESIAISPVDNLHNIRKILEELDISDVILPRTHIDVRVIFDERYIFVPKSHFELKIFPNIYFVFKMAEDLTYVKFLGFFEPEMIDMKNENKDYYFIEKDKLIPVENLKAYLENAKTSTRTGLSDEELDNFNESIINFVDNDIDDMDRKILLKVLTKSQELRNKFIEFENFELISYRAANEHTLKYDEDEQTPEPIIIAQNVESMDEFEIFEEIDENTENLSQTEDVISSNLYDDIIGEDSLANPHGDEKD